MIPEARFDEEDEPSEAIAISEEADAEAEDILHDAEEEADQSAPSAWSPTGAGAAIAAIDEATRDVHSAINITVTQGFITRVAAKVKGVLREKPPQSPRKRPTTKAIGWGRVCHISDSYPDDIETLTSEGFDAVACTGKVNASWLEGYEWR